MTPDDIRTAERRLSRQAMSAAEASVWHRLRNRQFHGMKFRRLSPVGGTLAAFHCPAANLALDLIRSPHLSANDLQRHAAIRASGCRLLVWTEAVVLADIDACLANLAPDHQP